MLSFDTVGQPKEVTVLPVEVAPETFCEYERTVEQMKKQKEIDGVLDRSSYLIQHHEGVLSIHVKNLDMSLTVGQAGHAHVFWEKFIYPDWSKQFLNSIRRALLVTAPLEIQELQHDKSVEDLPSIPIQIKEKRKNREF